MAKPLKQLYKDAKEGVIVRTEDLLQLRDQLVQHFRDDCQKQSDTLSQALESGMQSLTTNSATKSELVEMRATVTNDARVYSQECVVEASRQMRKSLDNLGTKEEAARKAMQASIGDSVSDIQDGLASLRKEHDVTRDDMVRKLTDQVAELQAAVQSLKDETINKLEQATEGAIANANKAHDLATSSSREASESLRHLKLDTQSARRGLDEARQHLERRDSQLAQLSRRLDEQSNQERSYIDEQVASLRSDADRKVTHLEGITRALDESINEVLNVNTRQVEWHIPDVAQRIRNSKTRGCFSPKFSTGGERSLQLELHAVKPSDRSDVGHESGDCVLNVWASNGAKLTFRLTLGTVTSAVIEHEFNGWEPYKSKRIWFIDDQVQQEDGSMHVCVEVLESSRVIEPASPQASSSTSSTCVPFAKDDATGGTGEAEEQQSDGVQQEGRLLLSRIVNHRLPEMVDSAVTLMKSHMLRRVEWRIEQASSLRNCYAPGRCICSVPFVAGGMDGLQLVFYPSGFTGARPGQCSFFLARTQDLAFSRPGSGGLKNLQNLQVYLRIGKNRYEASPVPEQPYFFGRANFCRFETCLDSADDTINLALEIQEGPQELMQIGSQQDPWRSPAPTRPSSSPKGGKRPQPMSMRPVAAAAAVATTAFATTKANTAQKGQKKGNVNSRMVMPLGEGTPRAPVWEHLGTDADRPTTAPSSVQLPPVVLPPSALASARVSTPSARKRSGSLTVRIMEPEELSHISDVAAFARGSSAPAQFGGDLNGKGRATGSSIADSSGASVGEVDDSHLGASGASASEALRSFAAAQS